MGELLRFGRSHLSKGTLFEDGTYKITGAQVEIREYDDDQAPTGKREGCIVNVELTPSDVDGNPNEEKGATNLFLSVGDADKFAPSEDGTGIEAVGAAKGINERSNYGIFLIQCYNIGVDESILDEATDVSVFVGSVMDFANIANPANEGKKKEQPKIAGRADRMQPRETKFLPVEVHVQPGEDQPKKKSAPAKGKPATKTTPAAASGKPNGKPTAKPAAEEEEEGSEIEAVIISAVDTAMGEKETIQYPVLRAQSMLKIKDAAERKEAQKIIDNKEKFTNLLQTMGLAVSGTVVKRT